MVLGYLYHKIFYYSFHTPDVMFSASYLLYYLQYWRGRGFPAYFQRGVYVN